MQLEWTRESVGKTTQEWNLSFAVKTLCVKPHRFMAFLSASAVHKNLALKRTNKTISDPLAADRDFIRDPSSPVPMDED